MKTRETAERIVAELDWTSLNSLSPRGLADAIHSALQQAIADERERCARICDNAESPDYDHGLMANGWEDAKVHLSEAIRHSETQEGS
jgi:hypothetical protein